MTRRHRAAHRLLWPVLAAVVGALFTAALVMRAPPAASASSSAPTGPAAGAGP